MSNWKGDLGALKRRLEQENAVLLKLPPRFAFKHHNIIDFTDVINFFDWSLSDRQVKVDFKKCKSANYQALSLLVLFLWKIRSQGCRVSFILSDGEGGASQMWRLMGAVGMFQVSTHDENNFNANKYKPLVALRNSADFKEALFRAEDYADEFNVEYKNTLRYVLSEVMYNTLEHGVSSFKYKNKQRRMPSIIQFTWYQNHGEMHFLVGDTGIGIKKHLEKAYPFFDSDIDAIKKSIRPQVSGTFGDNNPYTEKNNAGVGLFLSTNIIRKLNADMHIISGNGALHVSPRDITGKEIDARWPGTFILVSLKLEDNPGFALHSLMQEFREAARKELASGDTHEQDTTFYCNMVNYFGPFAEDKDAAISFRDKRIIPAIKEKKKIVVDFEDIENCPHSFLSALLATPVLILGMDSYKSIRIINASPEIRETIDYIFDENTD